MLHALDIPVYYYLIAVILGGIVGLRRKSWIDGLLAAYLFFILAETILSRTPGAKAGVKPVLFWSWKRHDLRAQVYANVILFIPAGILLGMKIGWKSIPATAGISVLIELIQLCTKRGMFEYDDIMHNTLGAVIGFALLLVWKLLNSSILKKCKLRGRK